MVTVATDAVLLRTAARAELAMARGDEEDAGVRGARGGGTYS
jgi:hypothetical protein